MPKTFTVKEVADALGFSTNTVYKYLDEGKIKATRLGSEGRFKIPASEVERLLGKPKTVQVINQPVQTVTVVEETAESLIREKPASSPELFDWLLSLTAVFTGISQLTSPIKNFALASDQFRTLFSIANIDLILAGGSLFALDMFSPKKTRIFSLIARIPLAATFGYLSYLHFVTKDMWQASYFFVLSLFTFASCVWPEKHFETKCSLFMFSLISITAIAYSRNPQPFIFSDPRYEISNNPNGFVMGVLAVSAIITAILIFAKNRSRVLYPIFTTLTGCIFLVLTISYIATGDLAKTIICLFTGCFALILPLTNQIESFSHYTKRQLAIGFIWIVAAIALGVVGVQVTKATTGSLAIKNAKDKTDSTAKVADRSISDASLNVIRAASDDRLDSLPISEASETTLLEMSKSIYFTSSLTRRVFFADQDGNTFGVYPPINSNIRSVATRDFFQQTKSTRKTVVSDVIQPQVALPATVYISTPIISEANEFRGTITIAIDPQLLQDRLTLMTQAENSRILITDVKGDYLFGQEVLSKESAKNQNSIVFDNSKNLAVQTKSKAEALGWNITLVQPYDEVFKESTAISSFIFFVSAVLGIGALLINTHLPHTQKDHE